tara:strand:- start:45314 stop:46942 length:1629 start_codon:yes stop_codon:yes gene_type:complete
VNLEDKDLAKQACAGDVEAFALLIERYQRLVGAVLIANTGRSSDIDDLMQDVFVDAWADRSQLRDPTMFRSWICAIARNRALNNHRSSGRVTLVEEVPLGADTNTPESVLAVQQRSSAISEALAEIPEGHQEVLVLFYREERSMADVANILGLSESAAQKRVSRARASLKPELESRLVAYLPSTRSTTAIATLVVATIGKENIANASTGIPSTASKGIISMKLGITIAATVGLAVAAGGYLIGWGSGSDGRAHSEPHATAAVPTSESPKDRLHALKQRVGKRDNSKPATRKLAPGERSRRLHKYKKTNARQSYEEKRDGLMSDIKIMGRAKFAVMPLIDECVNLAHVSSAQLYGGMHFKIDILGGEGVAGLVGSVEVLGRTGAMKREHNSQREAVTGLEECVRETMLGVEFVGLSEYLLNIEGGMQLTDSFTFYPLAGIASLSEAQLLELIADTSRSLDLVLLAKDTAESLPLMTERVCDRVAEANLSYNSREHCVRILCIAEQPKAALRHWKLALTARDKPGPPTAQSAREKCAAIGLTLP